MIGANTPNVAELTRRCHDTGFEQGSIAACNAILGFLNRHGHSAVASEVLLAWDAGKIGEEAAPVFAPAPPAILLTPPKISREQARGSGYTGDSCSSCQSMQVKRNGSCTVCEACGQTTGCS